MSLYRPTFGIRVTPSADSMICGNHQGCKCCLPVRGADFALFPAIDFQSVGERWLPSE